MRALMLPAQRLWQMWKIVFKLEMLKINIYWLHVSLSLEISLFLGKQFIARYKYVPLTY